MRVVVVNVDGPCGCSATAAPMHPAVLMGEAAGPSQLFSQNNTPAAEERTTGWSDGVDEACCGWCRPRRVYTSDPQQRLAPWGDQ